MLRMNRRAASGPCAFWISRRARELRQQLLRGGIELAAVVAKIQFGQVQPEGPSLRQQPLQPAACGAARAFAGAGPVELPPGCR